MKDQKNCLTKQKILNQQFFWQLLDFLVIKNESVNLDNANICWTFSREYSALACSKVIKFIDTIKLLQIRGKAMQNAVPKGEGGMVAILGEDIKKINELIENNKSKSECFLANDNSNGQVVISGKSKNLDELITQLKKLNIKNIKLPVSAPFHCTLMYPATQIMKKEIMNIEFSKPNIEIVSNVNAKSTKNPEEIKKLLIEQIEKPVLWRESIINMINSGTKKFIEIGPGKYYLD